MGLHQYHCPHCSGTFEVDISHVGHQTTCPKCSGNVPITEDSAKDLPPPSGVPLPSPPLAGLPPSGVSLPEPPPSGIALPDVSKPELPPTDVAPPTPPDAGPPASGVALPVPPPAPSGIDLPSPPLPSGSGVIAPPVPPPPSDPMAPVADPMAPVIETLEEFEELDYTIGDIDTKKQRREFTEAKRMQLAQEKEARQEIQSSTESEPPGMKKHEVIAPEFVVEEPVKTVGEGASKRELKQLTREEKARYRFWKNVIMIVLGMIILFGTVIFLKSHDDIFDSVRPYFQGE